MGTMDELINPAVVAQLRAVLIATGASPAFSTLAEAEARVPDASLRQRVNLVRDALLSDVPGGFSSAERLVLDALDDPEFSGWMIWPVTEFVASRALQSGATADFDDALALLARLTVGLTGEFAIRDLLIARPERALDTMGSWTGHDDEHVRRLATEGSRAYLPWAKRVPWLLCHPAATRRIIDATYRDPSEYVRRSTANHLNDLSRISSELVTEIAEEWAEASDSNTPWMLRHGLRTLIKQADPVALVLVGFTGTRLRVTPPRITATQVPWSGALTFDAEVTNEADVDATVAIDYNVGFRRSDGSISEKTFKLGSRQIPAGGSVTVAKTHSFRPITTRTYYPGQHRITVQANGVLSSRTEFTLEHVDAAGPSGAGEATPNDQSNSIRA